MSLTLLPEPIAPTVGETKEEDMHARSTVTLGLAVGLAGVALAAPLAQAATRPDDRAGTLGVGAQQVADTSDVISRYLVSHPAALRPDDRAGALGVGSAAVAADTSDVISRYLVSHPAALRPDDRAGALGVGSV